tara:strand:- start:277 stop:558 length:282 start_codon:yes stop_codon:yes gene_type:complete
MYITLDEDKIQLIIQALKVYSSEYRTAAGRAADEGYPESTRKEMLQTSVVAHDLCGYLKEKVDEQEARRTRRSETQSVDPYDVQWPINDPRKW